jgi:hypothetical protein
MKETNKRTVTALSRRVTRPVPADWGRSELTRFFTLAEEQALATFAAMPQWIQALELIDRCLTENAPTYFHEIDPPRRTASKLFVRVFGTYRAACRLALSGQLYETTVLSRSILETAMYAWVCGDSAEHAAAWEKRSSGGDDLQRAKDLFKWGDLRRRLESVDADTARSIQNLYEEAIEYGAHPNVDGVALSSEVKDLGSDRFEVSTVFLHSEEAVLLAILQLLRVMEVVYRLLDRTIRHRLRILGLDQKFDESRNLILRLIGEFEAEQRAAVQKAAKPRDPGVG